MRSVAQPADILDVFLEGAQVIATALADPAVADAWDRPSVLEDQTVGGLAGHLARGGGWVVADYLEAGVPDGPADIGSAGEYFAVVMSAATEEDHRGNRARGATVAAAGGDELRRDLGQRLDALGPRLRSLPVDHLMAVIGGRVMRLDDYLATRIVEQVVHLDDLARSVDREPWSVAPSATDIAIAVGADIACRRGGSTALMRALYRRGFAESVLPVF